MEQTLIILKPDCVQRRLIGRILQRFEDKGFTIAGMKLMQISRDLGEQLFERHEPDAVEVGGRLVHVRVVGDDASRPEAADTGRKRPADVAEADDADVTEKFSKVEQERDLAGLHDRFEADVARWEEVIS